MSLLLIKYNYKDLTSESFMTEIGLGQIGYDQYKHWTSWATIASISKRFNPSRKGDRSIVAKSFLVDTNKFPIIVAGKPYNNIGIIKTIESSYKMHLTAWVFRWNW